MASSNKRALLGNESIFHLKIEGCSEEVGVVRFSAREAISTPYELRIEVAAATLALDALVGKWAVLTIEALETPRYFHGIICEAGYVGETSRYTIHELVVVPDLWKLSQRADCRIFQQQTTPQILSKVLELAGLQRANVRLDLNATYVPNDYCVQYRESDLDFIQRLMENSGIYYYFEHLDSRHILVMTDIADSGPPIGGEPVLKFADAPDCERVTSFRLSEGLRPQRVSLRDKNLHKPDEAMTASEGAGEREIYDYPGNYQVPGKGGPETGRQQARLRLEALQATRGRGRGASDSPRLTPGYLFTLADAVRPHLEGGYRITSVMHHGEQPQVLNQDAVGNFSYGNEFECTDKRTPFRPERRMPRPRVQGSQTATVTGPAGEEIHVDEHGRIKVQFHWDRLGKLDEASACWVRVSQAWAGNGFGAMFIPRVGHEVIVDFLEGDPDRPIVTGRVYTGFNATPYPLPDEKTKSTIKSESSPGGGGYNEVRFEDAKGSEEIFVHGQKDWNIVIEHDKTQQIGHDESLSVGHDRTRIIGNDDREKVGHDRTTVVGNNHAESIGTNMDICVGANLSERIGANASFTIQANMATTIGASKSEQVAVTSSLAIGAGYQVSVGGALNETIGLARMEEVGAIKMVNVGQNSSENIGGGKSVSAGGNITESAGKNITLKAGKHLNGSADENINLSAGKKVTIKVGEKLTIQCGSAKISIAKNGDVSVDAKKLNVKASGDVTIKGSKVKMN